MDGGRALMGSVDYKYDGHGRVQLVTRSGADGAPLQSTLYVYDATEPPKVELTLPQDGPPQKRLIIVLNPRGAPILTVEYAADGALAAKEYIVYSPNGLPLRRALYTAAGVRRLAFDGRGFEAARIIARPSGKITERDYATFNKQGDCSKRATITGARELFCRREVYTYQYDPQGNWTRRDTTVTESAAGVEMEVAGESAYREIRYYLADTCPTNEQGRASHE